MNSTSTQSLLQPFYFAAAVIVLALVILRIIVLRRRHQALSDFFRIGRGSQYSYGSYPPYDSNFGSMYHGIHGIQLAPVPAAYHPDRRIRAADADAHGRRLGPAGEAGDGKDALPAYDNFDRPPKYIGSYGGPPPPTAQSVAIPSLGEERSGMAHPNTTNGVPGDNLDQPFEDTHATAAVAHGDEAPVPPPARHDLSNS